MKLYIYEALNSEIEMLHVMFPDCWKEECRTEVATVHMYVPTHLQVHVGTSMLLLSHSTLVSININFRSFKFLI